MQDQSTIRTEWQDKPEVVVSEAVAVAMEKSDPSDSINALLSYIGASMNADRAYIFEFTSSEARDTLYNSYEWCADGVSAQIDNLVNTPLSIYERTWRPRFEKHEPVIIRDMDAYAAEDPAVADILRPQDITSLIAIPLFIEERFVGFIGIDNPSQGVAENMAAFLETLATFTAALLRHRDNVKRVYDLSSHDKVSGAYNTLYLLDALEQARQTGNAHPADGPDLSSVGDLSRISVVYCNIVQFKEFNGAFGIEEGNRCLKDIAQALGQAFGTRCVSRYSADHFVVFYGGDDLQEKVDRAHELVLGLRDGFNLWLEAGICTPGADQKLSTAVDLAKVACDQVPKDGQSYRCLYTGKIEEELERKKYLQDHIGEAIDKGWIQVYYQPVIRTLTGRLASVEALSRWFDPTYGAVSPGTFVPALEERHLSWKLLTFVIDRACHDLAERYHQGRPVVPVSINVSRTDFESCDPFDVIQSAVERYDIPQSLICVEITESVAMGDPAGVEAVVQQFRKAGYEVWMDDFGSAYSSLNTLKDFSFSKLKLDMFFMHNFDDRSKIIISSIISMAKRLGVHTLAEGVETREQVDFLLDAGCEEIQGFYFSKPLPLGEVIEFARNTTPETHEQRKLYDDLGLVKLHFHDMAGLVYPKGGQIHALYGNERMRRRLRANGLETPNQVDALINDMDSRFAQCFHAFIDRAQESHETEVMLFSFQSRRLQLAARVAAQSEAGTVLLVNLVDVTAPSLSLDGAAAASTFAGGGSAASWSPALMQEAAIRANAVDMQEAAGDAGADGGAATGTTGGPVPAGEPSGQASANAAGASGRASDDAHPASADANAGVLAVWTGSDGARGTTGAESDANATSMLGTQLGERAAAELRRGFSIPSVGVSSSSMDIRHSKGDSLETYLALSSLFITLVSIDFETWRVQPIKIARVTRDYLSEGHQDYRSTARQFIQQSVSEEYRDVLRRFIDPNVVVDRLSQYGTISIDYVGANLGWCRLFLIPIATTDEGRVTKALLAVRDINAEKAEESRMNYEITHDPLTKALNRNGLRQAVKLIGGYTGTIAYALLDVDDFKGFNDAYGHEHGDDLLMAIVQLLIDSFDATDYVARIGGDEFVVLFTHYTADENGETIRRRMKEINRRLASASEAITADAKDAEPARMSMSAGIVVSLDGYHDELYNLADQMLYREKQSHKGGSSVRVLRRGEA